MTTKKVVKEAGATAMDVEVVAKLLQDAKALYDVGKFTTLYQDEFFAAMAEQIPPPTPAPTPPPETPAPSPAPESSPNMVAEGNDAMTSTATVGTETRGAKK
jgi:hypothetical protein